jgi:hypothetical protein
VVDIRVTCADGEITVTAAFETAWRLFLVAVCWWLFRPHWPVSGTAEVAEGVAFLLFAALAVLGQIGDRD